MINKVVPFKFWCQKVLPLVYDDALSYYEVLCKLTEKVNKLIENDDAQTETIQQLNESVAELDDFADNVERMLNDFDTRLDNDEVDIQGVQNALLRYAEDLENLGYKVRDILGMIAPEYSTERGWYVNDYCRYNGAFYRCVTETEFPAGEWNPIYWSYTRIGDELSTLMTNMEHLLAQFRSEMDIFKANVMNVLATPFRNYEGEAIVYVQDENYVQYQGGIFKCILTYTVDSIVPTPVDDTTHWQSVRICDEIANLNAGGGGGGGSVVGIPDWDENVDYPKYAFVNYNDGIFMSISSRIGVFDPTEWEAISPFTVDSDSFRILNVTQRSEYDGSQGALKGELKLHRRSDGAMFLDEAYRDTSGVYNPSDWIAADLLTAFNTLSYAMWGYGVETYDPTKTYNKGDIIVNYAKHLEVCKADNVTGTFDPTKWDYTTIVEVLANIANKLNNLNLYNGNLVDRFSTNVTEVI